MDDIVDPAFKAVKARAKKPHGPWLNSAIESVAEDRAGNAKPSPHVLI